MPAFVLQQVSSKFARENAGRTLEKPVGIKYIEKYICPELTEKLKAAAPKGAIRIWGAKYERSHQFRKMPSNESIVLFRRGKQIFSYGVIIATTTNEKLAQSLWSRDSNGETWPLIFFLRRLVRFSKDASTMNLCMGRKPTDNWQGLTSILVPDSEQMRAFLSAELTGEA
jgi:hypothetical protein